MKTWIKAGIKTINGDRLYRCPYCKALSYSDLCFCPECKKSMIRTSRKIVIPFELSPKRTAIKYNVYK